MNDENNGLLPVNPAGAITTESVPDEAIAPQAELPITVPADDAVINDAVINDAVISEAGTDSQAVASATGTNARLLALSFTDDCWIKITDSQGKVLSEGVKKAEQSLALEGEPPFKLILGVPTAVRVEYLSKAVDLSSFGAGRAARLTVPQS